MSLPPHRATDLATAYKISDVQPLTGEDLDRYYVDLGAARKNDAIININCTLELQEPAQHDFIYRTSRLWEKHRTTIASAQVATEFSGHLFRI
jgi:hypothetical protein